MIKNFIDKLNYEYYQDASLKKYNTYRLNTKCQYLILPKNKEELLELLKELKKEQLKYLILGNGSNIILKCDYYDGVVILLNNLKKINYKGLEIEVEAGYSLQKLALETSTLGFEGLEFASGIPGQIGASTAMNAGAYKHSLSEVVESVEVIDDNLNIITMRKEQLEFSYRNSVIKKKKNYIIISVNLLLKKGDKQELLEKMSKRRVKRIETQPLDMPSAGSVFRNPEGYYAGELIEKCGLKGYEINGAKISEKHANFIINNGECTGKDIIALIEYTKTKVKEEFNVELLLEQIIID